MPPGTIWNVSIISALAHGGPAGYNGSGIAEVGGAGAFVNFSVVTGHWGFRILTDAGVLIHELGHNLRLPHHPGYHPVQVPPHSATKLVRFKLVTANVLFQERGLHRGTNWSVTVAGPMSMTLNETSAVLRFALENGTYTYTVAPIPGVVGAPTSGYFQVIAPTAHTIQVNWTSVTGHFAVAPIPIQEPRPPAGFSAGLVALGLPGCKPR